MWRKRFFEERLAGLEERSRPGRPRTFSPELVVRIKALACELPATHCLPLSRWGREDLARYVCQSGLVASISGSTLWRWLHEDAIRPWQYRSWVFPRDPNFAFKAGRILNLYERQWDGRELRKDEFVISADEKTSIQLKANHDAYRTAGVAGPVTLHPCQQIISLNHTECEAF